MPNLQLTDQAIRRFASPSSNTITHWDTIVRGLGVRVSPKGLKTFIVLIDSGRRHALGRYPALSLAEARAEAKRITAEKTLGSIKPTHTAFDDARDEYLKAATVRASSLGEYKRLLTGYFPFGRKSVATITSRDIMAHLKDLKPSEKHHAYSVARAFFRFCLRNGYIEKNPFDRLQAPTGSEPRDRVLTKEELAKVLKWALADTSAYAGIVSLLALTGQRRGEIAALQRHWLKGDTITLPADLTKNGRRHTFPVGPMVLEVLQRQPELKDNPFYFPASKNRWHDREATIFNGWNGPKEALDLKIGVTGWTLHDLRRTFATGLASLQVQLPTIERFLNHVSGSFAGIVGVYQRYDFMPEMREAVTKWEAHLHSLLQADKVAAPKGHT